MKCNSKYLIFIIIGAFVFHIFQPMVYAKQKYKDINPEDVFSMSIEEMLQVVVVTAGKKKEIVANIPASVVIITRADIERYGFSCLEEILENVPGMYKIDEMSGYKPIFGVRGFWSGSPRNIIFMINGISQAEGIFDNFSLAQFNLPVEAIDRIEVIRGPMSVIYGPGSFYGAINIITNDIIQEKISNIISVSYGSQANRKLTLRSSGKERDLSFVFNVGYSDTDGPNEPLSKMSTKIDSLPYVNNTNNTTKDKLESEYQHINFSVDYKKLNATISFNRGMDEIYLIFPTFSKGSSYLRETAKMSASYKEKMSDLITVSGKLTYHHFFYKMNLDWLNADNSGYTHGESQMYECELMSYFDFDPSLQLTSGFYLKRIADNTMSGNMHNVKLYFEDFTIDDIDLLAFFAQADYKPMAKLRLIAGFRLEQLHKYNISRIKNPGRDNSTQNYHTYEEDDIDFIPRLAAIFSLNERNVFKFLYGKAISRPSFFQNEDQMAATRPDLKVEEIQTFELNYIAVPLPNFTINTSIFHNILENLIVRTFEINPDQSLSSFSVNAGKMTTNGIELTVQTQPVDKLLMEISATYQDTSDERDGFNNIDVEYSPHILGYFKGSYKFNDNITFSLIANYVDEMKTHWKVDQMNPDGTYGGRVGEKTDAYFTIGANLRMDDIAGKGWFFNLHGTNLLNEDYLFPTYTNNSLWEDKGTIGDPLSVLCTIGRKF
ncbi:TonB-dependent receptor plug protein [Candidatus Magnetomorum sp. HK-1]|nr:TonB-dependent receptor plug protein [Candidatus Magnetomorum sp. HK-1]